MENGTGNKVKIYSLILMLELSYSILYMSIINILLVHDLG